MDFLGTNSFRRRKTECVHTETPRLTPSCCSAPDRSKAAISDIFFVFCLWCKSDCKLVSRLCSEPNIVFYLPVCVRLGVRGVLFICCCFYIVRLIFTFSIFIVVLDACLCGFVSFFLFWGGSFKLPLYFFLAFELVLICPFHDFISFRS